MVACIFSISFVLLIFRFRCCVPRSHCRHAARRSPAQGQGQAQRRPQLLRRAGICTRMELLSCLHCHPQTCSILPGRASLMRADIPVRPAFPRCKGLTVHRTAGGVESSAVFHQTNTLPNKFAPLPGMPSSSQSCCKVKGLFSGQGNRCRPGIQPLQTDCRLLTACRQDQSHGLKVVPAERCAPGIPSTMGRLRSNNSTSSYRSASQCLQRVGGIAVCKTASTSYRTDHSAFGFNILRPEFLTVLSSRPGGGHLSIKIAFFAAFVTVSALCR